MVQPKHLRKELRQLAATAHDRELGLYLSQLESHFAAWRAGELGPGELADCIHGFHEEQARAVHATYSMLEPDQLVARAIGIGLLKGDEVPEEVRQALSDAITHFRDNYAIDEDDPLWELRDRVTRHATGPGESGAG